MKTPVVFLIFNRPETTRRVFAEIAKARPPKLLVIADGPRQDRQGEAERCTASREIIKEVNWDCEVITHFSDTNMGCKNRVSSGLTWAFQNVEEAIILEDDCLPHPTFFNFCEALLEKYRDNPKVMQICGVNMQDGQLRGDGSYYFSKYNPIWGWATWQRAFKNYDVTMKDLKKFDEDNEILKIVSNKTIQKSWMTNFRAVRDGKINTWDYQWTFAIWRMGGLVAVPNVNLISNIGFGELSAHTSDTKSKFSNMKIFPIENIIHPSLIEANREAENFIDKNFITMPFIERVRRKLERILAQ